MMLLWNVWPHSSPVNAIGKTAEGWRPIKIEPLGSAKPISTHLRAQSELAPIAIPKPVITAPPAPSVTVVNGCGDNFYANYIYMHESGCNLRAQNSIGCLGIGQACPGSKLTAECPGLDYACENGYFTEYANSTYGGWAQAYQFWLANKWW